MTKAKSTNRVDVLEHFKELKRNLRSNLSKPYVIMDNCKSHHSPEVVEYLNSNFRPLFLPSYSPEFNSIECLWAIVKENFKRKLVDNPLEQLSKD